ncbi:Lethal(2)neighbour of tid protein [Halteromyces radiatus]|uniref:Lethal(2)neighbour of tid protein n=1 Tax=Halteromyces radiatus TaxID=101107 RepID=UPI002220D66C|nr:Lethal(2)neighbour of tid protein [Halteromyces radiatus]KAI8089017.1 Lethal(2)neighbour of tid protein [Halteromyces radiatus]
MGKRASTKRRPVTSNKSSSSSSSSPILGVKDLVKWPARLLLDPSQFWTLAILLLVGEAILNLFIIQRVQYTEIDWKAYMQQVTTFLNGERDYTKIRGDTGPLVYPAGFLYIYSFFYYLTQQGTRIRVAQYLFAAIYLVTQYIVFSIYAKSKKIPPYVILMLCISKRLHSIYVLRCFNDPVAMLFMYGSILALIYRRWWLASTLYSVAMAIKMNVLLFFPGLGVVLWQSVGAWTTFGLIGWIAACQCLVAYPFWSEANSYFLKAFEFSRVFDYQWTVNWRMIDEKLFVSQTWANWLLLGHLSVLFIFVINIWCKNSGGMIRTFLRGFERNGTRILSVDDILSIMFTSNLIGMTFARSLHYQFYSWYFHTLPYLVFQSVWVAVQYAQFRTQIRLFLLATLEGCWLTFPSTENSSWTLLACHVVILMGILNGEQFPDYTVPSFLLPNPDTSTS